MISLAPTGSGKTLAYGIPILQTLNEHKKGGIRALIFAPTVELGEQIERELSFVAYEGKKTDLKIKFIHKIELKMSQLKEHVNHIDILICTPLKFIKVFKEFTESLQNLEFVVFDEADKYFDLVKKINI